MIPQPRLRRLAQVLAAALLAHQAALADDGVAAALVSVDIVGVAPVHGPGIDRRLLPYPVQAVSGSAVRKAGGDNLAGFMASRLAGVNINEVSGSPFQNDVTYRGFRASPVLGSAQGISVYLDGVRVNEPFGDVVNWDMIPEAAIASLLLAPGSNPLYGLNTLGGALALETRSGESHPGVEAELSTSSKGRRRADLGYGVRGSGGWHSFVGATLFDDDGWRDHSDGRMGNALVKVGHAGGDTDWSAALLAGRSRLQGNGLLPDSLYQQSRGSAYTFPDQTRNRLVQATLRATHRVGAASEISATAYARDSRRDTVNGDIGEDYGDYAGDCESGFNPDDSAVDPLSCRLTRAGGAALHPGVVNTTSTRQDSQGMAANYSARSGGHRIDAGITFDRSDVNYAQFEQPAFITPQREVIGDAAKESDPSSSVTGSSRAVGLYVADTWALSAATHLSASARVNRARVGNTLTSERGPQPHESFSYTRINPSLGLTHALRKGISLFANVGQGNRVPTVIELGCADPGKPCRLPVGLQSDPYLKQVISRTWEAGLRGKLDGGEYSLSLYRTANRDDILFLSAGPSRQGYFSNFGRTRHQGFDATFAHRSGDLAMRGAYSYLEAEYDADGELFTGARKVQVSRGTRIAGLPRHTAKLGLEWRAAPALALGADLQAVSSLVTQGNEDGLVADAETDGPAERGDWRVHGYALLNLRASFNASPRWEFFARVTNVFDRRYETFGVVAPDLFPAGGQLKPHEGPVDVVHSRFVAPGAGRTFIAGARYTF